MIFSLKNIFYRKNIADLNFYHVFKPLYIVLSLLGLFPYSIRMKSNEKTFAVIPKTFYYNLLCAVSLALGMSLCFAFHLQQLYTTPEDNNLTSGLTTFINYGLELLTLYLFCIVMYICIFKNGKKLIKVLKDIATNIDIAAKMDEKIIDRVIVQVNGVMCCWSFLLILQIAINFSRTDSYIKMLLVFATFNLPQIIQFAAIGLFYILVISAVFILRHVRNCISQMINRKHVIYDGVGVGVIKVLPKQNHDTLRQAEKIYTEIVDLVEEINKVFEAPILVSLGQCFHSIVSELHIVFHGITVGSLGIHGLINCSVWVIYQYLKVYVIALVGNKYKVETLKISRVIHRIPTDKHELRFLLEVQHFSSLINAPGAELSVLGYFPIDSTLFLKVVASTAMYFIILVQFEIGK